MGVAADPPTCCCRARRVLRQFRHRLVSFRAHLSSRSKSDRVGDGSNVWDASTAPRTKGDTSLTAARRQRDQQRIPHLAPERVRALEANLDCAAIESNTFELEWPPRSGRTREFPEVDRAEWFPPAEARRRLNPAQAPFVDRLLEHVRDRLPLPEDPGDVV